jgi:hypothetical protein
MAYKNYTVAVVFNDGSGDRTLPVVQSIDDPKEGINATIIQGTRAGGSIVIPGGKKSQNIKITGIVYSTEGYEALTEAVNTLKGNITTLPATLTLKHWDDDASAGGAWVNDWSYTVRRTEEINFSDKDEFRTGKIEYTVSFLVLAY